MDQELRAVLAAHAQRYPAMAPQDAVKLIYQNEFGGGHMIADPAQSLERLRTEYAAVPRDFAAPLAEDIGNGMARIMLAGLDGQEYPLERLNRDFVRSAALHRGRMGAFLEKLDLLRQMAGEGAFGFSAGELEGYLDGYIPSGCPAVSHSEAYRAAYRPAYRVVCRSACLPLLVGEVRGLGERQGRVVIALDGRCASGKTTFAARCAQVFPDCSVFHMDDFFLPFAMRTPERLAQPGGNVDYERALEEVFAPLSRGEDVELRAFDCSDGSFRPAVTYPFRRLNIVEGSYSHHPALAGYSQVKIFLTCSPQVQLGRLAVRESAESLENFKNRWIPMEENYFTGLDVQAGSQVAVDTSALQGEKR